MYISITIVNPIVSIPIGKAKYIDMIIIDILKTAFLSIIALKNKKTEKI
jgi:hypothetical protein